jgi:hypothetical protein
MTRKQLIQQINKKKSYLCVGLDTDITKIPPHLLKYKNPVLEFNKQIIDATHDLCVAYKPNIAFYEQYGAKGWETLEKTVHHIPAISLKLQMLNAAISAIHPTCTRRHFLKPCLSIPLRWHHIWAKIPSSHFWSLKING